LPGTKSVLNLPVASLNTATQGLEEFEAFLNKIVADSTGVPSDKEIDPANARVLPPSIIDDSERIFRADFSIVDLRDFAPTEMFSFTALEVSVHEIIVITKTTERYFASFGTNFLNRLEITPQG
jgi:hypothetical protein